MNRQNCHNCLVITSFFIHMFNSPGPYPDSSQEQNVQWVKSKLFLPLLVLWAIKCLSTETLWQPSFVLSLDFRAHKYSFKPSDYIPPSYTWSLHPVVNLDPVGGEGSLVTRIGLLHRALVLLSAFASLVRDTHPCVFRILTNLACFHFAFATSQSLYWLSSHLLATPTVPKCLKVHLQGTTNTCDLATT